MRLKSTRFLVLAALVLVLSDRSAHSLLLIPSMLMAMTVGGGLLMTKMTMGGLLMMMMAANQQQQQGQNFLRNLGLIPQPTPSSGVSVPTNSEPIDLIVRRKRSAKSDKQRVIDSHIQYRVMRQVANSDPLGCLPKALCTMGAKPPDSQTGLLNDYTYLLKTVFTRDEDFDDLDAAFDDLKSTPDTKGKTKTKNQTTTAVPKKKKNKDDDEDDLEESSEEEVDDEEIAKERRRDQFALDELANEELVDDNPDFLPYAMQDATKKGVFSKTVQPPPELPPPDFAGISQGDLSKMSDVELDAMLAQLGGVGDMQPPRRPGGGGLLNRIIPQFSWGLSSKGDNQKFDDDPFFQGFKRRRSADRGQMRFPNQEEEQLFQELKERRVRRRAFLAQKRKELEEIMDPVEKFRIAAEVGQKLKSPRQCRLLFNSCPFNYTQVLGMIADLRKVIMGQPLSDPQRDTVVDLKPQSVPNAPSTGKSSVINLSAAPDSAGVTSIIHQLPNGEKVEINLKLSQGKAGMESSIVSNSSHPKTSNTKTKPQGSGDDKIFDDEEQEPDSFQSVESLKATVMAIQTINNLTTQAKKKQAEQGYQLGNKNLTNSDDFDYGFNFNSKDTQIPPLLVKLLVQNNRKKNKTAATSVLTAGNGGSNDPVRTAALLATSLTKSQDDEMDDTILPNIAIKRLAAASTKSNSELAQILQRLKTQKQWKTTVKQKEEEKFFDFDDKEQDDHQQDSEEDDDDEEESESDDLNNAYKIEFGKKKGSFFKRIGAPFRFRLGREGREPEQEHEHAAINPVERHLILRRNARTPRKLFLGHEVGVGARRRPL